MPGSNEIEKFHRQLRDKMESLPYSPVFIPPSFDVVLLCCGFIRLISIKTYGIDDIQKLIILYYKILYPSSVSDNVSLTVNSSGAISSHTDSSGVISTTSSSQASMESSPPPLTIIPSYPITSNIPYRYPIRKTLVGIVMESVRETLMQ